MSERHITEEEAQEIIRQVRQRNGGRSSLIELMLLARGDKPAMIEWTAGDPHWTLAWLRDKGYAIVQHNASNMSYSVRLTKLGRRYLAEALDNRAKVQSRKDAEKVASGKRLGRRMIDVD